LLVGVVASGLAVLVGLLVGLAAGYFAGPVDSVLSRFMDVVLSLPYLVFAIALVSLSGPSLTITIAVIAFFSWASVGRIVRGQVMAIKEREFIEAARAGGSSHARIMFVDLLPNVLAPTIIYATMLIPLSIVFESTLSFLGIGVLPPTATWGNMLAEAIPYYQVAWWFVTFPGLALLITTMAFNLLGDSIRDAFDPRASHFFATADE
jgi:peptide/nickel transport system permease protein